MASPAFQSKSDLTGGFKNTSATIAVPASVAADDIIVVAIYRESTDTPTITGFTLKTTASPTSHRLHILWKRATGADAGNYTIGLSVDNVWTTAAALRISGCITSGDPWDTGTGAPSTNVNNSNSTTAPTVSLTTTVADTLLLYAGTSFAGGAWTAASGMTERTDTSDDLTTDTLAQASAAGTGNKSATCAGSGAMASFLGALMSPSTGTSAPAENAAGTGAANAATAAVGVNAGNAAGTGAANDATVSTATGTSAPAEVAAATGTAYNATVSIGVAAGVAAATGTAYDPTTSAPPSFDFPATPLGIHVYHAPGADPADDPDDWPWDEITEWAMSRNRTTAIRITRQATPPGASARTAAAPTCTFEINNRDRRFMSRNPTGPYYPLLQQGTPIRVTVEVAGVEYPRFTGRWDELPTQWDVSGNDCWVNATASGMSRRFGRDAVSLGPAASAATSTDTSVLGNWPCTDAAAATSAAEVSGGLPMAPAGTVVFGARTGPDGLAKVPSVILGGKLSGTPATTTVSTEWTGEMSGEFDTDVTGTVYPLTVETLGTAGIWRVSYVHDPVTTVTYDSGSGPTTVFTTSTHLCTGGWHSLSLRTAQSGGNIAVSLYVDNVLVGSGTATSQTNGRPSRIQAGDGRAGSGLLAVAGVRVYDSATPSSASAAHDATQGYMAETTLDRAARLCIAQGVPYEVVGTTEVTMGPQSPTADFLTSLAECPATDGGTMVETTRGRMAIQGHSVREDAEVALTLDSTAGELGHPWIVDDSDRDMANDVEASMADGSIKYRATDDDHIAKYQRYQRGLSVNPADAPQLAAAAGLAVWLGTYDLDYRYPSVRIDLADNPRLAAAAVLLDASSRIQVVNRAAPESAEIDLILDGLVVEELGQYRWWMEWATSPRERWDVGTMVDLLTDTDGDWAIPDTFVLAEDLDTTETAVDVTAVPVLPTDPDEYPVDVVVGGERMTVTACSGAGPTQTLTVTRSANDVVVGHSAGDTVEILSPLVMTM
jgi:hypothetical protein